MNRWTVAVVVAAVIIATLAWSTWADDRPTIDPQPMPVTVPDAQDRRTDRLTAESDTARLEAAVVLDRYRATTAPKWTVGPHP